MTPAVDKLILRTLILIAGQVTITNAEKLVGTPQEHEALDQINILIAEYKKLD